MPQFPFLHTHTEDGSFYPGWLMDEIYQIIVANSYRFPDWNTRIVKFVCPLCRYEITQAEAIDAPTHLFDVQGEAYDHVLNCSWINYKKH